MAYREIDLHKNYTKSGVLGVQKLYQMSKRRQKKFRELGWKQDMCFRVWRENEPVSAEKSKPEDV